MWVLNQKYRGVLPPKWMVYFMEKPMKMDDLGVKPTIFPQIIHLFIGFSMKYTIHFGGFKSPLLVQQPLDSSPLKTTPENERMVDLEPSWLWTFVRFPGGYQVGNDKKPH